MRSPEPPPSPALIELCSLGDSFTEGLGAPQDETWVDQLSRIYRTQEDGRGSAIYVNLGVAGSDIFDQYQHFEKLLKSYKIDQVLLSVNATDIGDVIVRGGFSRYRPNGSIRNRHGPWWEPFYAMSFIVRKIVHDIQKMNYYLVNEAVYQDEIQRAEAMICVCHTESYPVLKKEYGFKLAVIFQPLEGDLQSGEHFLDKCRDKLRVSPEVQLIELDKTMETAISEGDIDKKKQYWEIDQHFTEYGYRNFAELIFKELNEK